jgi:hypothetical protein
MGRPYIMSWEEVDVLLVDAEVQLLQGLRNILMQEGYRGVRDVSTVSGARDSISKSRRICWLWIVGCRMATQLRLSGISA